MNNYLNLMRKILKDGVDKGDTVSLFGETLSFNLQAGFPLVTTRKINYKAAFGELACFVRGFTDIKDFNEMGVKFWDADCKKESWRKNPNRLNDTDLGKIYGYQWVKGFGFNQLTNLIKNIRENPESRRHILTTFNPGDLDSMCLPPCYVSHQFYVSEKKTLNMLVHQRSADLCIGVPFDIASFALFQHLMAKETGLEVGELKIIFGDVHIYQSHFYGVAKQVKRVPFTPPRLKLNPLCGLELFQPHEATMINYRSDAPIAYKFEVQS